jgi:hypothetical protein
MRVPPWRLALTGGAIVILVVAGVGIAAASSTIGSAPPAPAAAAPPSAPTTAPGVGPLRERLAQRLGRVAAGRPFAGHLVHATVTVTDKDGNLVMLQLDHGTIAAIEGGTLAIAEAGGASVTVSTDDTTVVRLGRGTGLGALTDLKVGDEIVVQSRIDGSTTLARHVLLVPASTAS